jgi:hypothetical protein
LTEESQYDEIFTALKHPVRRQILLFIDTKGATSFTEIQQETGITDTGLMSYHLKGLASLVEQSKRGKYQLSEVGQAGITLLRKADHERERTSTVVHQEIERFIGLSIKKSVLFLLIAGLALCVPSLLDIYFLTNFVVSPDSHSIMNLTILFFVTITLMVISVFLFETYDRHYYSKKTKTNIIHGLLFTLGISTLLILQFNMMNNFSQGTILASHLPVKGVPWAFEILRIGIFISSAPTIAYFLSKRSNKRGKN